MKDMLKKVLCIVVFVIADILIFALLAIGASSLAGKSGGAEYKNTEAEIMTETAAEAYAEETSYEYNALYEKSTSPVVNWMREKDIKLRFILICKCA